MSKIFRAEDCDTGETDLELYVVPEGACLHIGSRDGSVEEFNSVIIPPDKAVELAAWLAARFAGRSPDKGGVA